jgi:serine/threonine protein kinase
MKCLTKRELPKRFEIMDELGRGGTSVVYRARDGKAQREVAIKVLLCSEEAERFALEVTRLKSLSHQNIVSYLEVGQHQQSNFLVMECLPKGDLTENIRGLSHLQILEVFMEICDGLTYLHNHGVVHRDVKPANILFDADGKPKIVDLGLSRDLGQKRQLTKAGTILGTYSYVAPEQILCSQVGPSADLYSLGVCLFQALTGVKPFGANNEFSMLQAHLHKTPPSLHEFLPDAPDSLATLVADMMAKETEHRPASAQDVAGRIARCMEDLRALDEPAEAPNWEEDFESLEDGPRSVLLVAAFLEPHATFERLCLVAPYAEDKTDLYLEELLVSGLVRINARDEVSLAIPRATIQAKLTPRVRRLFEARLSAECHEENSTVTSAPDRIPTIPVWDSFKTVQEPVWLPEDSLEDFDTVLNLDERLSA